MTARVLIVEDHEDLAFGLQRNLEFEGYEVDVAASGSDALTTVARQPPDVIILDLMLPDIDGLSVLRRLRSGGATVPVLILTARGEELDKVRGLRSGADDYLTKPFGVLELVARVEALLRRAGGRSGEAEASVLTFADVEVDVRARSAVRSGRPVSLTPREFDLLVALLRQRGVALSRRELLRDVWGHRAEVSTRTVDTHVGELRRKLEADPARPEWIVTVRKHGYRLEEAPPEET